MFVAIKNTAHHMIGEKERQQKRKLHQSEKRLQLILKME